MNLAKLDIVVDSKQATRELARFRGVATRSAMAINTAFSRMGGILSSIRGHVFSLKTAFATLGVALVARDFMQTANFMEQTRFQLVAITRSAEKANKIFANTSKFASEVSFGFQELFQASKILTPVLDGNAKDIDFFLRASADIASTVGISVEQSAIQMQKALSAGIGASEIFREKGVSDMLGFASGVAVSADQTRKKLEEFFSDSTNKVVGNAQAMSSTFLGVVSMINDKVFNLKTVFMDSGVFDFFKALAIVINDEMARNMENLRKQTTKSGEAFTNFLQNALFGLAGTIEFFKEVKQSIISTIDLFLAGYNKLNTLAGGYLAEFGFLGFLFLGSRGARGGLIGVISAVALGVLDVLTASMLKGVAKAISSIVNKLPPALRGISVRNSYASDPNSADTLSKEFFNEPSMAGYDKTMTDKGYTIGEGGKYYKGEDMFAGISTSLNAEADRYQTAQKGFRFAFDQMVGDLMEKVGITSKPNEKLMSQVSDHKDAHGGTGIAGSMVSFVSNVESVFDSLRNKMDETGNTVVAVAKKTKQASQLIQDGFDNAIETALKVTDRYEKFGQKIFDSLGDGLEKLIRTGNLNFKNFMTTLIQDFLVMESRLALTKLLGMGGGLGTLFNAFSYGGGMAGGGQVSPNRAYTVGERGRETFVPSSAGRIVPNGGEGGGGVQIVQHFDFSNADEAIASRLARTAQNIKDETFNSVFGAINAGGQYAKVAGRR